MSIEEAIELLERSIRDGQRMIDEHSLLTDEHGYKEFEDEINARKAILALLKTHPDNQPNEPLTLEELREMDGQPVWIVGVASFNNFNGQWDICSWENGEVVFFPDCAENPDVDLYGVTWKAYRRPPKEET